MSARKGIKIFGDKPVAAIFYEYQQLDTPNAFMPMQYQGMPQEHKKNALNVLDIIKEKRRGKIKERTIADGRSLQ